MERFEVATIIPAYNEEKTIDEVVSGVVPFGCVIVVNDCSIDNTAQVAENAGAVVVSHSRNMGYDNALNSGFQKAYELGSKYAVTFDADGQHHPQLLGVYVNSLKGGYDLVLGVRPETARLGEKVFGMLTKLLYGINDPLCGMKGYNLNLYKKHGCFDSYGSIGTELALKAVKNKCSFVQVPVPINVRLDNPRFGNQFRANLKIFRALCLSFIK